MLNWTNYTPNFQYFHGYTRSFVLALKKLLFFLVLLTCFRLVFYLIFADFFATESAQHIALAFIHGIRFDGWIIGRTLGILLLIDWCLLSLRFVKIKKNVLMLLELFLLFWAVSIFFFDVAFFDLFQRHISSDVWQVLNNMQDVLKHALFENTAHVLSASLSFVVLAGLYIWLFYYQYKPIHIDLNWKFHSATTLCFFIFILLIARGGWQDHPNIFRYAFWQNSKKGSSLTMGNYHLLYQTLTQGVVSRYNFLPDKQANENLQAMLGQKEVRFLDNAFPAYRHQQAVTQANNYNVVVVVLESWLAEKIGAYYPEFGHLTPKFDQLAKTGQLFLNFYANGIYTNQGYAAILNGIPTFKHITLYNSTYIDFTLPNLFHFLPSNYYTLSLQPYQKGSSYVSTYMEKMGIDKVYTQEDFPAEHSAGSSWGVWDEYSLPFFFDLITNAPQPFFAITHTTTTHVPCNTPEEWNLYGTEDLKNRQMNAIAYSDHHLGLFMQQVFESSLANNTIFVFVSDHTFAANQSALANRGRIPLLIITPDSSLKGKNSVLGMQTDLAPTILDLLGINANIANFGSSLLRKTADNEFATHVSPSNQVWIQDNKLLLMDEDQILGYYDLTTDWFTKNNLYPAQKPTDSILQNYFSYTQAAQNLLLANQVQPFAD